VDARHVFDGAVVGQRADVDADLGQRRTRIGQQPLLEVGIDPGLRHHLGAERRRAAVHQVDLGGDLLRGEHALLDQERADRLFQQLVGADRAGIVVLLRRRVWMLVIVVVMIMVMIVVVVVHLMPLSESGE
jgi:hypothetical protein